MKIITDIQQGSPEWHNMRKTRISATLFAKIAESVLIELGYKDKPLFKGTLSKAIHDQMNSVSTPNEYMQYGSDREAIIRQNLNEAWGVEGKPIIVADNTYMASIDMFYEEDDAFHIVEIKTTGKDDIELENSIYYYHLQMLWQWYCIKQYSFALRTFDKPITTTLIVEDRNTQQHRDIKQIKFWETCNGDFLELALEAFFYEHYYWKDKRFITLGESNEAMKIFQKLVLDKLKTIETIMLGDCKQDFCFESLEKITKLKQEIKDKQAEIDLLQEEIKSTLPDGKEHLIGNYQITFQTRKTKDYKGFLGSHGFSMDEIPEKESEPYMTIRELKTI
jgi:hypothetical protein